MSDDEVVPPVPLLPCPFCGHRAVLTRLGGRGSLYGWVECVGCRASLPFTPTFEMACVAWNRRSHPLNSPSTPEAEG